MVALKTNTLLFVCIQQLTSKTTNYRRALKTVCSNKIKAQTVTLSSSFVQTSIDVSSFLSTFLSLLTWCFTDWILSFDDCNCCWRRCFKICVEKVRSIIFSHMCVLQICCVLQRYCVNNHSTPIGLVFTCRGDGSNVDFAEIWDALSLMFSNLSGFCRNVGWWFKLPGGLSDMFSN